MEGLLKFTIHKIIKMSRILFLVSLMIISIKAYSDNGGQNIVDTLNYSDTIILSSGNNFIYDCYIRNDSTIILKRINAIEDSTRTIIIKFDFVEGQGSYLKTTNQFSVSVFFKAELFSTMTNTFISTNSYPVRPRRFSTEMYGVNVSKIRLTGFKLVDEKLGQKKKKKKKKNP